MKAIRKGKTLTVVTLVLFAGLALYLCPCSFAESSSGLTITKARMHDCCEGMSECPLKTQNTSGMQSFLDSFSHDGRSGQFHDLDLTKLRLTPQLLSSVPYKPQSSFDFVRRLEDPFFKANPPELFIRFESLLI